jgi:hypothetical protein
MMLHTLESRLQPVFAPNFRLKPRFQNDPVKFKMCNMSLTTTVLFGFTTRLSLPRLDKSAKRTQANTQDQHEDYGSDD